MTYLLILAAVCLACIVGHHVVQSFRDDAELWREIDARELRFNEELKAALIKALQEPR